MVDDYQVKEYEVKLHPSDSTTTTVVLYEDYKIVENMMVMLTEALEKQLNDRDRLIAMIRACIK